VLYEPGMSCSMRYDTIEEFNVDS